MLVALAFGAFVSSGCIAIDARHDRGWAAFQWTLEEQTEPRLCETHRATWMSIVVLDDEQRVLAQRLVSCASFGFTVELTEGHYSATLTLVDSLQKPVSSTLTVGPFVVWPGSATRVPTDFPASALDRPL